MYSENLLNWNSIELFSIDIANNIKASPLYYNNPSLCIVGISRGGLVPARLIARELNVREIYSIAVSSYTDETNIQQNSVSVYQGLDTAAINNINKYSSVLFVDDIVDSGSTLDFITDYWLRVNENASIYAAPMTASLIYKPKFNTVKQPDFFSLHVSDSNKWIIFPWEDRTAVDSLQEG